MASVLHGSARTTPRVRAELQASQTASRALAAQYGVNPKTILEWRRRTSTTDAAMGPKNPRSTVLTTAEKAIIVEFRRRTLLPLDDMLGCLRDTISNLSRSALHRCLQRHGISRLPKDDTSDSGKRFKSYEIGYVHIDSCELRHADGKLILFLAIDRVSKFTYVEFYDSAGKAQGADFLRTSSRHSLQNPQSADRQRLGLRRPAQKSGKAPPGVFSVPISLTASEMSMASSIA